MKTTYFFVLVNLLFSICFTACDREVTEEEPAIKTIPVRLQAVGPVKYGGNFRYNEEEYFRHLFPHNIRDLQSRNIAANLYEGLLSLSIDSLKILPLLADLPMIAENGRTFTFTIRDEVFFHDDPCFPGGKGRKVTAHDFKYSFDLLCTAHDDNYGFWIFDGKVKGARNHFNKTTAGAFPEGGVAGIQVTDSFTLTIELERPYADFSALLTTPFTYVIPFEAIEKYGTSGLKEHAVGTGPFQVASNKSYELLLLKRNHHYHQFDEWGNQLPYLDSISVSFHRLQKTALLEFERNRLDMVFRIPLELYDEILDNEGIPRERYRHYQLQSARAFSTEFYGFQHDMHPYNNPLLRKALAYAIDRNFLVDQVYKGMAEPNFHGVVPRAMQNATGFPIDRVPGFEFDPEHARRLLDSARMQDDFSFKNITLQINEGGGKNEPVANAVKAQINAVFGVDLNIEVLPFREHFEKVESGEAGFFRVGWSADYVSPENFLRSYYSPENPPVSGELANLNIVRYHNPEFDRIYEKAMQTLNEQKRQNLYARADSVLMADAVVIPLFNHVEYRLLQDRVKNLPQNPMELRIFKEVYFDLARAQ